jgi:hypothetical protein
MVFGFLAALYCYFPDGTLGDFASRAPGREKFVQHKYALLSYREPPLQDTHLDHRSVTA